MEDKYFLIWEGKGVYCTADSFQYVVEHAKILKETIVRDGFYHGNQSLYIYSGKNLEEALQNKPIWQEEFFVGKQKEV